MFLCVSPSGNLNNDNYNNDNNGVRPFWWISEIYKPFWWLQGVLHTIKRAYNLSHKMWDKYKGIIWEIFKL